MKVQLTTQAVMTGYQAMEQLIRLTDAVSMHVWEIYEKYMGYIKYTGPAHEHWEIASNGYEVLFSGGGAKDRHIPLRVFTNPKSLPPIFQECTAESEGEENAGSAALYIAAVLPEDTYTKALDRLYHNICASDLYKKVSKQSEK